MDNETNPDIPAFLASAIHDMKNSVSMLIGFLEENMESLDASVRNQAAPMLYEVKRVNINLIQMLSIYKVGNNFYPFDLAENSIDEFVNDVAAQNRALLDYMGIELVLDYDPAMVWYFDRELVSGAIMHALNNAAHYTKGKLKLSLKVVDGMLEIRVEDNGSGYPADVIEAGDAVNKGVSFASGSTGLGLYFSAMVARLHKNHGKTGAMTLENGGEYGGGCFVLRLP
ncbi:MAG: HAMP domain-containing sensor histidine kinase [Sulfuricellaceae bacterium]